MDCCAQEYWLCHERGRRCPVAIDARLNETLFSSLAYARAVLQTWKTDYNVHRPHSRIGWLTLLEYAGTFTPRPKHALLSMRSYAPVQDAPANANFGKTNRRSELKRG